MARTRTTMNIRRHVSVEPRPASPSLRKRSLTILGAFSVLLAFLWFGLSCMKGKQPNVVLVTIDTLRADRVGCYGDSGASTPNMDRLAKEGILFEDAVTPVPITLPSHTTMLTGLLPAHHGVRNNGAYTLSADVTTLAERFQDAGYRTGGFVSAFVLLGRFGISQGFQVFDDSLVTERSGTETVGRALRWIDAGKGKPFFLWVHLYEPHRPWTAPPPYLSMPLRSGYEREVAAADGALGVLLDRLRAQGLLDRTVVAVLGDHGEGLNDHGEEEHGVFLYSEVTRIPWIMRLPAGRGAGLRVQDLISTVDLAPTLCALARIKPIKEADGFSLTPALAGRPLPPRTGVYLETYFPKENYGWSPLFGYETRRWKWIRAPQSELYDLKADSQERVNLAASEPDTAARLDGRLEEITRTAKADRASSLPMSSEVLERLRSLGYISAENPVTKDDKERPDPKALISVQKDLENAKNILEYGQPAKAIPVFRKALAKDEQNGSARMGLGYALIKTTQYAEAEVIYRRVLRQRPGSEVALRGLADALFGQEKWKDAFNLYMCEVDATLAPRMRAKAATCQTVQGDWAGAQRTLAEAEGKYPDKRDILEELGGSLDAYRALAGNEKLTDDEMLRKASLALRLHLVPTCERLLTQHLSTKEGEIRRLKMLGEMYSLSSRPGPALETLARLTALDGRTPDRELMAAVLQVQAGMPEAALATSDKVLREGALPQNRLAILHFNRCRALTQLHRVSEAMVALTAAVDCGYFDLRSFLTDPDLDPLRESREFLPLVNRVAAKSSQEPQKVQEEEMPE